MSRAESPSALLKRLRRVAPVVQRAVIVAVALGLAVLALTIVQAVSLASTLASLFHHAHLSVTRPLTVFFVATIVRGLLVGGTEPVIVRIASPLRATLRRRAFDKVLQDGPLGSVDATVQLATKGLEAIEFYVAKYLPAMMLAALAPLLVLGWLALHDWWSFAIVLVCLALLPVFMILLGLEARDAMHERWAQQQALAGYFGDVVRGLGVLKAFNRDHDALDNLTAVGEALRDSTMRTLRVAFLSSFALELLSSLATALVALVLGLRLLNGSLGLNVALAILLLTPEAFLPLRRSAAQFHASSDGIAAATELLGLLEQPTRSGSSPAPVAPPALELRGVRTGAGPVPDLHLRAGSTLILEGPSGSGKTTLLQVLAGVRPLTSGAVVVDGTDLATMAVDEWHRVVGYVVQDAALPGETVADVLTGGDDTFDDAQLTGALRDVGLDLALDRVVGEGGGGLSAGQRRRLALARSILRRPLVLLLDEPLAHLDPDTASAIAAVIEALPMTRVIATHRPMVGDVHLTLATEVLRG